MLWHFPNRLAVFIVAALLAAGCAGRKGSAPDGVHTPSQIGRLEAANAALAEEQAETLARYAAGVSAETLGNTSQALAEYLVAAQRNISNESLVLEVSLRLIQNRQMDQALELVSQSAARPDATALLLAHHGWLCAQTGRPAQALASSEKALQLSPTNLLACQNLVTLHLKAKHPTNALQVLEKAAAQAGEATFCIDLAELFLQFNRQAPTNLIVPSARLQALLQRARQPMPEEIGYQLKLAELLAATGDVKASVELYLVLQEQFAEVPALRDGVRAKLAELYLQGQDRKRAMQQLEAIIKDHPRNAQAFYFLGGLAYEEKEYARAAQYFAQTILLNPNFEPGYYDTAAAYISANQAGEALAVLARARDKFAGSFTLEYFTGLAHSRAKAYDQAVKALTTAEIIAGATDPQRLTPPFYFQIGAACERIKRYEEAESYFQKAIAKDPDFSEALNYLGYMWVERGTNLQPAKALLDRALKLEPKNAAFLDSMGWLHYQLGEWERARELTEQAIALNEEPDATLHDHLGDIHAALKQWDKARAEWEKSLKIEASEAIKKKLEAAPRN